MKCTLQKHGRIAFQFKQLLVFISCTMGLVCGCTSSETVDQHTGQTEESDIQFGDQKIPLVKFVMPGSGKKFYIGKYEVTNDQYLVFLNASGYDGSDHPSSKPAEPFFTIGAKIPNTSIGLTVFPLAKKTIRPAI